MNVLNALYQNMYLTVAVILFVIGLATMLFHNNLIKKVVGLGIMDTSVYLMLTGLGYVTGKIAPIVADADAASSAVYGNPIPTGLVLTGIVVSVSVTAFLLALTVRLYKLYGTLDLDEILSSAKKGEN